MRKIDLLALALTGALVGACNTMEGIGRDVQAAGRGLENMSNQARGEPVATQPATSDRRGPPR